MADAAWEGTSGRVADFEGDIVDAYFSFGTGQAADRTMLYVKVQPTDGTDPESDDGLVEYRYSCGSGWRTVDGGETVEHDNGSKKFHQNTAYYKFVARVVDLIGRDQIDKVFGDDGPRNANIWKGCKFYWLEEDASFMQDGKKVEGTRVLPSKWLGKGEVQASASGAASGKAASGEGYATLVRLAKEAPDYSSWISAAMPLQEIASNGSLVEMLGDESNYQRMKGE